MARADYVSAIDHEVVGVIIYCLYMYIVLIGLMGDFQQKWKKPVVFADIQQSTNPPAVPPPTQPAVYMYADIQQPTITHQLLLHLLNQ